MPIISSSKRLRIWLSGGVSLLRTSERDDKKLLNEVDLVIDSERSPSSLLSHKSRKFSTERGNWIVLDIFFVMIGAMKRIPRDRGSRKRRCDVCFGFRSMFVLVDCKEHTQSHTTSINDSIPIRRNTNGKIVCSPVWYTKYSLL